jgi:hypothetical protein
MSEKKFIWNPVYYSYQVNKEAAHEKALSKINYHRYDLYVFYQLCR